jgi:LuxR family maltose regulon positive regulatory protein
MPKAARYTLIWSMERGAYELYERGNGKYPLLQGGDEEWYGWLAAHASFAFQGRDGHLNLLKEGRKSGGQGYWYAYRSQGGRTAKRYVGSTEKLSVERLESTARAFTDLVEETAQGQNGERARAAEESIDRRAQDQTVQEHEGVAPSVEGPLLMPKLHLPRLHSSLIVRERLLTLLDEGLERRLTLVSASAGFGKTTLVRQWIAEGSESEQFPFVAWVSLDVGDNDPVRFWRYVMTACQSVQSDLAQEALALLQTAPQPPFGLSHLETLEAVLTTFLNGVAQCTRRGILVLEDYHVITTPRIHEMMTFLLDHLPANLHIVMITRSDPPLPLARLRARNELCEVRATELRFSHEETATFLKQAIDVPLTAKMIRRLNGHLEGWAAGLRMVMLALQGQKMPGEIERLLMSFAGDRRSIQEYFVSEVLSAQEEPQQRFLLQTSILSRLTGSLCDAVIERQDSGQILAELERANLFLEPLDDGGQWYRYHALFAEAMRAEARRRLGEEVLCRLSSHASKWYEERGLYAEAVEAALHAQDYRRAAILIEQILEEQSLNEMNEYHTLEHWLKQIPEDVLSGHPILCLGYAVALLFVADTARPNRFILDMLEKHLRMAEQKFGAVKNREKLGDVYAVRALVAWVAWVIWRLQDGAEATSYARQALAYLPEKEQTWRGLSMSIVGKAELLQSGNVNVARKTLMGAHALCEAVGNQYFKRTTTAMLARVFFEQGELHRAAEYYQQALREAREREYNDDIGHTLLGLAEIAYERNELETAHQQAQEALAISQYFAYELNEVHASLMLARVHHAWGETTAARQRLAALLDRMPAYSSPQLYREVQTMQARLALASGDLAAVQRWVNSRDQSDEAWSVLFAYEKEELLIARWWLEQGKVKETLRLLEQQVEAAQEAGRIYRALEMQVVIVLAYVAGKQMVEARQRLLALLEQTHVEGYLRLFLDEGAVMATLLRSLVPHVQEKPLPTYLQSILHVFPSDQKALPLPGVAEIMEPLSAQELRVLRQLALGWSNGEIARELVVSINTVRTQVQSIYRKLNVHNRMAAGEVARRLDLV